ncbi:hypothetical protein ACTHOQ_02305 [Solibacillus silvestris]|uniref:hypothetical protein n=1 Tax=Solibacillus silvestris TaxID=76853 RepID=UPI003F7DE29F
MLPPIVFPPTFKIFREINKLFFVPKLTRKINEFSSKPIILLTYLPTETSLDLSKQLKPVKLVYDCVLNFENFPGVVKDIKTTENILIKNADCFIVDSIHLHKKHKVKRKDIIEIPAAVNFEHFNALYEHEISNNIVKKATYFGGIDNYRMDWDIIRSLLSENIVVELIGPAPDKIPVSHPNLIHKKPISHHLLPQTLKESDVLILPYKITEFTKGTFPAKLFECFATGKPIVATALPDLEVYEEVIDIGRTPDSFASKVKLAVKQDLDFPDRRLARLEIAKENSWENRCNYFKDVLENKVVIMSKAH